MTQLIWDAPGKRVFTAGVDRGVLYPIGKAGVAWNGLTKFSDTPTGGGAITRYRDGEMIAHEAEPEVFGGSISAMTYPVEFEECDGTASTSTGLLFDLQPRKTFHLSWRSLIGNDLQGVEYGYRIHLLYNALAAPSPMDYSTLTQSNTPGSFSWALTAQPVAVPGMKSTPHVILDTTRMPEGLIPEIEKILYGTASAAPRMPTVLELLDFVSSWGTFKIVANSKTGLSQLVPSDTPDLMGYPEEGMYEATKKTRLSETDTPGLYRLEE